MMDILKISAIQSVIRILTTLCIVYMCLLVAVFFFQNHLLYAPKKSHEPESIRRAELLGLIPLRDDDHEVYAWYCENNNGAKNTALVFHGNAGEALDRSYYIAPLLKHVGRVVLAEYPGYGHRKGKPSESSIIIDAQEIVKRIRDKFPGDLLLWGESMGCGVVTAIVRDMPSLVSAAVLLTPWSSLADVAQKQYWFLPVRMICREGYNNVENLKGSKHSVVFLLAENDEVTGLDLGRKLYDSFEGTKHLIVFKNAGHNSWPADPNLQWWYDVFNFFNQRRT